MSEVCNIFVIYRYPRIFYSFLFFRISGLSGGQRKLCMLYTAHKIHVGRGARTGIGECQFQFRNRRRNCSTVDDSTD